MNNQSREMWLELTRKQGGAHHAADGEGDISVYFADNSRQSSHVPVFIHLLDVNDNAPTLATVYETFVCERTKAGQVPVCLFVCLFVCLSLNTARC